MIIISKMLNSKSNINDIPTGLVVSIINYFNVNAIFLFWNSWTQGCVLFIFPKNLHIKTPSTEYTPVLVNQMNKCNNDYPTVSFGESTSLS